MKITKLQKEAIVRAIMNDVPKPDKSKRKDAVQAILTKAMTPECRKVFLRSPEIFKYTYVSEISYPEGGWSSRKVVVGDAPSVTLPNAIAAYKAEDAKHEEAYKNLKNAIMACTTLKALETTFPEFKKYFPTAAQPTKNLPALANVVSDLSKLGWPKKSGVTK